MLRRLLFSRLEARSLYACWAGGGSSTILDTLGNLGDFIGGIAVIVTLAYLAFQMRQNTKTVRANSVRELTESILSATAALVEPGNAEVYLRGARSYSALTAEEKFRFGVLVGFFLARLDTVLEYRQRGMVDDEYVAFHSEAIRIIFENPGVREWWESHRENRFTARVRVWLNENVA